MMINNGYNEDVLLKEDAFESNYSCVYDAKVVACVREESERFYHQNSVE